MCSEIWSLFHWPCIQNRLHLLALKHHCTEPMKESNETRDCVMVWNGNYVGWKVRGLRVLSACLLHLVHYAWKTNKQTTKGDHIIKTSTLFTIPHSPFGQGDTAESLPLFLTLSVRALALVWPPPLYMCVTYADGQMSTMSRWPLQCSFGVFCICLYCMSLL